MNDATPRTPIQYANATGISDIIKALRKAQEASGGHWTVDGDIAWSEGVKAPETPLAFAQEAIWVICNSGMKNTVARLIFDRVIPALLNGLPASTGFGHKGKAAAMQSIWDQRATLHKAFLVSDDKLAFCASLPWIGEVTKYHLAKNYGVDCCKPDVHLVRLGQHLGEDPHALCARLARETGYRIATIDLILWRACAVGVIDSRSGTMRP